MPEAFDPYHSWLGIAPHEQPANHYRLLGISLFESDPEVIDNAADREMAHLRNYQTGKHQICSQQLLNEVAAARVCLLKPATKAAYDSKLRAEQRARETPPTALSLPVAAMVPQAGLAIVLQGRPVRPPDGQTAGESPGPQGVLPSENAWNSLLGDVGSSSKIEKASTAKLAAAKRRKTRFIAVPVAVLLLVAAVALGLKYASRSRQPPAESGDHQTIVARPASSETKAAATTDSEPKVAPKPDIRTPILVQPPAVTPLVIDWPLEERRGAALKVDDQLQQLGQAPKFELAIERGLHTVRLTRPGFGEFAQSVSIGGPDQQAIRPIWHAEDGTGLRAELYQGARFERPVKSRVDPVVDFLWGYGPPDLDLPHERFSIRWTGYLKAPKPGKYKLIAIADDSVKVSLDGAVCLKSTELMRRYDVTRDLTGEPQPIEVEYFQNRGTALVSLRWVSPGHVIEQVIPATALFYDKQVAQKATVPDTLELPVTGGSRAQLFDDQNLRHMVKTRIDPQIDFLWGFDPPDPELPQQHFSIRWTGVLQPPDAGKYTLVTVADDGIRVWLDDVLEIDNWKLQLATRTELPLDFDKHAYRIRVEYFQVTRSAICSLRWIRPGEMRDEAIPSSVLRPPGTTVSIR